MILRRLRQLITKNNLLGLQDYIRRYGWRRFLGKVWEKILLLSRGGTELMTNSPYAYKAWINRHEPGRDELARQRQYQFKNHPRISLVVPCYRTPLFFLKPLIKSVQSQTYSNWQLCLAVAGQLEERAEQYLQALTENEPRIIVTRLATNDGISRNTNAALDLVEGDYVGLVDHDDTLAEFALFEVVKKINETPDAELIYSDEDKISVDGKHRHTPHFKPEWSPDLLRSYNYITHLLILKRDLLDKIGPLREEYDGCQDYDLVLRASEQAKRIAHIPKVLYHWRQHPESTSANPDSKPGVTNTTVDVVRDHLKRTGRAGKVSPGPFFGSVAIAYQLRERPLVSIIIPSQDHLDDLRTCLDSIISKSTYSNFEIIVMENHSRNPETFAFYKQISDPRIKVVTWEKPFNYSQINNDGAKLAKGDILVFLNNDVEVQSRDWLEQMLMHAQHDEVGAVGAMLYYPDGTVQHAGVILGIGGVAGHPHKGFDPQSPGYFGRLKVVQNFSAVTAACLMVSRANFQKVGGFDEGLPIAFNDVDFCLKLRRENLLVVWTPKAELIHYESKTRGYENTEAKRARFKGEVDYFKQKWSDVLGGGDPYYSPNLTLESENLSINVS